MRRWSLALLLTAASPAFAQEAQEAPAAPAAEPAPAAAPTAEQAPAGDAAPAEKPSRRRAKQEAPAEAPAPEAQAPAVPELPLDERMRNTNAQIVPPQPGSPADRVRDEARYLLSYLLTGDVRGSVPMLSFPFQLEERRFDAPESLVVTWVKQLRNKRTDLVTLYDIEVLPYAEMEKKYGKPPARLGAIAPARGTEVYAAVANLSGHAAVILYRQEGSEWKAFAYTD
ncbi:hypothetical protein [Archangium sp.]|uniref:hypothetical protein n=1 Tax=Archangium sp. TaxID=1872627 RepID=UPI00389A33A1